MLLEARDICFRYGKQRGEPLLLDRVCFHVEEGERVGLVGPSGCGKSTLSKLLAGFEKPLSGEILFRGAPLPVRGYRPVQLVYQHPERAVNPRWKLGQTVSEGWEPTPEVLKALGIEEAWLNRWPNELSGGELQRICVARALGPQTKVLIADEMSTMLDVITQAQIWQLVGSVIDERTMGLVVVTHDEALADRVCDRIVRFE